MSDGVVLLHGIFRTSRSMRKLARFLEEQGYQVLNLGYPSTRHSIDALAEVIYPQVEAFAQTVSGKLHFVGYSMGGLLIRAYLHKYPPVRMGRVVMIGTPNRGSEVADKIRDWWLYHACYGPAGQQLVTDQSDFGHIFGEVNYELGVIAGNRSIDPIGSYMIGGENDGKVSVESTRIEGMKAHVVLPSSHTFFPDNKKMWQCVLQFLKSGELAV